MWEWVHIAFLIGLIVVGIKAHRTYGIPVERARRNWRLFARRNGLDVSGPLRRPVISGNLRGHHMELEPVDGMHGNHYLMRTRFHVRIGAPMPRGIHRQLRGLGGRRTRALGGQNIGTGDARFDAALSVRGQDVEAVRRLLADRPLRSALLRTARANPTLEVEEHSLQVIRDGWVGELSSLERTFHGLVDLAEAFEVALGVRPVPAPEPAGESLMVEDNLDGENSAENNSAKRTYEEPAFESAHIPSQAPATGADEFVAARPSHPIEPVEVGTQPGDAPGEHPAISVPQVAQSLPPGADAGGPPLEPERAVPSPAPDMPLVPPADLPVEDLPSLLDELARPGLDSGRRERLLAASGGREYSVELVVRSVGRTVGFDVPPHLRDGRRVDAELAGSAVRIEARFPPERNNEIDAARPGDALPARVSLAHWDPIFRRARLDAPAAG